jgi:hypothetical protein
MSEDTYRVEITGHTTKIYYIEADTLSKATELAGDISEHDEPESVKHLDSDIEVTLAYHANTKEGRDKDE